jgi:hypothetical protein
VRFGVPQHRGGIVSTSCAWIICFSPSWPSLRLWLELGEFVSYGNDFLIIFWFLPECSASCSLHALVVVVQPLRLLVAQVWDMRQEYIYIYIYIYTLSLPPEPGDAL